MGRKATSAPGSPEHRKYSHTYQIVNIRNSGFHHFPKTIDFAMFAAAKRHCKPGKAASIQVGRHAHRPMGPWANGPIGPWAHGPMAQSSWRIRGCIPDLLGLWVASSCSSMVHVHDLQIPDARPKILVTLPTELEVVIIISILLCSRIVFDIEELNCSTDSFVAPPVGCPILLHVLRLLPGLLL